MSQMNWEDEIKYPVKAPDLTYAYILKSDKMVVACTHDELIYAIQNFEDVEFVTTPEHNQFILPGTDLITSQAVVAAQKRELKGNITMYIFLCILLSIPLLEFFSPTHSNSINFRSSKFSFLLLGLLPLLDKLYEYYCLIKVNESNCIHQAQQIKFKYWLGLKKQYSIYFLSSVFIVIKVIQFIIGIKHSVDVAGLVKFNTQHGEYWRMLTCVFLHGSILHLVFNTIAFLSLGIILIRVADYYSLAIVFLVSGFMGSAFSVAFGSSLPSVGASGAIMGLIGYLLVLGLKNRKNIPREFVKALVSSLIMIALLGVLAFDLIDNAAHAGGFVGGMLIGILLIQNQYTSIPIKTNSVIKLFGIFSAIVLLGVVVAVVVLLLS